MFLKKFYVIILFYYILLFEIIPMRSIITQSPTFLVTISFDIHFYNILSLGFIFFLRKVYFLLVFFVEYIVLLINFINILLFL